MVNQNKTFSFGIKHLAKNVFIKDVERTIVHLAGLGGSVGCAVRPETRRSRVQEGQLSVSGERMSTILVNRLEDSACPVNVWLGKLTALDTTPLG